MVPTWSLQLAIRNALIVPAARPYECDIAVKVRTVWKVEGELWVDAIATGWQGRAVRVHLISGPRTGTVWVEAADVKRR